MEKGNFTQQALHKINDFAVLNAVAVLLTICCSLFSKGFSCSLLNGERR